MAGDDSTKCICWHCGQLVGAVAKNRSLATAGVSNRPNSALESKRCSLCAATTTSNRQRTPSKHAVCLLMLVRVCVYVCVAEWACLRFFSVWLIFPPPFPSRFTHVDLLFSHPLFALLCSALLRSAFKTVIECQSARPLLLSASVPWLCVGKIEPERCTRSDRCLWPRCSLQVSNKIACRAERERVCVCVCV